MISAVLFAITLMSLTLTGAIRHLLACNPSCRWTCPIKFAFTQSAARFLGASSLLITNFQDNEA